jgi:hypothetical protein
MTNKIKSDITSLNLAYEQIEEILEIDGIIHIAVKSNQDAYVTIDCYQEYLQWWIENKATEDCFIIDYDYDHSDGSCSREQILDTSLDVINIPDFEEYVRHITGEDVLKMEFEDGFFMAVDLNKLRQDVGITASYNRSRVPNDLKKTFDQLINQIELINLVKNIKQ